MVYSKMTVEKLMMILKDCSPEAEVGMSLGVLKLMIPIVSVSVTENMHNDEIIALDISTEELKNILEHTVSVEM